MPKLKLIEFHIVFYISDLQDAGELEERFAAGLCLFFVFSS